MPVSVETLDRLAGISNLQISRNVPLRSLTRFGVGGPADFLVESHDANAFVEAVIRSRGKSILLGGGTNVIASDEGFRGIVLRYRGNAIRSEGLSLHAEAGAVLQAQVDFAIATGLAGMETMTGIPGWVGAAVYGNAGAYGQSIEERVARVRIFDGAGIRWLTNAECGFRYRSSRFKERREWIVLAAEFAMYPGEPVALRAKADEILAIRNAKYPPTMKCSGSIFKNCIVADLPDSVRARVPAEQVRGGKIASAWFLEKVRAKGIVHGGIRVADYHANLIYNAGDGTSSQVVEVIDDLKLRVRAEFGFDLEEEVQYVGFSDRASY